MGGSEARFLTSASVIVLPSSTPPRITRIFPAPAISFKTLAAAAGSASDSRKAIAVGPSSSSSRSFASACSAASRVSVFFTTV